jgi:hypothetical protein
MLLTVAITRRELVAEPVQAIREPGRHCLDGLLLGLLPETLVLHEHAVDGVEQRLLVPGGQMYAIPHPLVESERVLGVAPAVGSRLLRTLM